MSSVAPSFTQRRAQCMLSILFLTTVPSECFSIARIRPISLSTISTSSALSLQQHGKDVHIAQHPYNNKNNTFYSSALYSTLPTDPVVMEDDDEQQDFSPTPPPPPDSWTEKILSSYLGPRLILGVLAAVYATNFPLGALMNDALPASAATSARMLVAALALSPFILHLKQELRIPAVLCGFFTCMGYVTQSLSLVDTDPARVSFLGSLTVLWCPLLEAVIEKKPMGIHQAPQTWLAAILCIAGIGVLELYDASGSSEALSLSISSGDVLALLQAVGFGTGSLLTVL